MVTCQLSVVSCQLLLRPALETADDCQLSTVAFVIQAITPATGCPAATGRGRLRRS
jgi:hypothetical protein